MACAREVMFFDSSTLVQPQSHNICFSSSHNRSLRLRHLRLHAGIERTDSRRCRKRRPVHLQKSASEFPSWGYPNRNPSAPKPTKSEARSPRTRSLVTFPNPSVLSLHFLKPGSCLRPGEEHQGREGAGKSRARSGARKWKLERFT